MIDVLGALGSILLALCSIPLAIDCWINPRKAKEITSTFLHTWMLGELFTVVYVLHQGYWILLINYSINILGLAVVYWMRYRK